MNSRSMTKLGGTDGIGTAAAYDSDGQFGEACIFCMVVRHSARPHRYVN
jgi:hypothetical protein